MKFQSTPSVWRETVTHHLRRGSDSISIHSLRVEGDGYITSKDLLDKDFNPLPPCGGRPEARCFGGGAKNFNPLPPCGGRPGRRIGNSARQKFQSTPSVWRETCNARPCYVPVVYFNPLPPCGGRPGFTLVPNPEEAFQSTPSVWRETLPSMLSSADVDYFNPLPPCGGRQLEMLD